MMTQETANTITPEQTEALQELFRNKTGEKSLMQYLQQIQEKYGYIPDYTIKYLSDNLNYSESHIFGVITFYAQFRTIPVGKNIIKVCHGTACHVGGAKVLGETLKNELQVDEINDTTADGVFTVQDVACLGCCALAPAVMINGKVYGNLDVNSLRKIIQTYREKDPQE